MKSEFGALDRDQVLPLGHFSIERAKKKQKPYRSVIAFKLLDLRKFDFFYVITKRFATQGRIVNAVVNRMENQTRNFEKKISKFNR